MKGLLKKRLCIGGRVVHRWYGVKCAPQRKRGGRTYIKSVAGKIVRVIQPFETFDAAWTALARVKKRMGLCPSFPRQEMMILLAGLLTSLRDVQTMANTIPVQRDADIYLPDSAAWITWMHRHIVKK